MPETTTIERTLTRILAERRLSCGDRRWLVAPDREATYAEMAALSARLAGGFAALGIASGDTVLLLLDDPVDLVGCWCGLSRLGAIEVPVNANLRGSVLAHVIDDSRADTLVVGGAHLERLAAVAGGLRGLRRLVLHGGGTVDAALADRFEVIPFEQLASAAPLPEAAPPPAPDDVMAVMYTSGTTGVSKGVMVTHTHAYEYARAIAQMLELGPDDVYYGPLPLFHIAGQWAVAYASCVAGATAVLDGPFSRSRYWQSVNRHGATCGFLLGAMASFLQRSPPGPDDASTLERVHMVPLLPDTAGFERRFGCRVSTSWASTEANVPIRADFGLPDSRTCGRPAADLYDVVLVDDDGREVGPGEPGEALVRPRERSLVMTGYWNQPARSAHAWRDGWLRTGDRFTRDEQGNFYFLDRLGDAIRRRGENISSIEVEREIASHDQVLECAVVPVRSADTEQEVMAFVVPRVDGALDPAELVAFLAPRMAPFMVPRYVELAEALPRTQTGKVQKYVLRERGIGAATWDREAPS